MRFQGDDTELGRHLTGLSLLLQQSEMMSEGEKLVAQEHLKRFTRLIKNDPYEDPQGPDEQAFCLCPGMDRFNGRSGQSVCPATASPSQ